MKIFRLAPMRTIEPLQPSSNAARVRCTSAPARSCSPIGIGSLRWRLAMRFPQAMVTARPSRPVA